MIFTLIRPFFSIMLLLLAATAALADGVVITAVGDIMLAGRAAPTLKAKGYDYAFAGTVAELRKGDILVGNLEAPLAVGGQEFVEKKFRFKTRPQAADALKRVGFSVLTLANNHMMDYGAEGLAETLANLDRVGISHSGAGATLPEARRETVVTVKGKNVAFLAYSLTYPEEFFATSARPGTALGLDSRVREDVSRVRPAVDYVVVSFHWGAEGKGMPKPYQRRAARTAIDAGADLIIGHHPHVLQGVEQYRGKSILYSLGNFAFGSMSRTSDRSIIARITLDGATQKVEIVPLNVLNSEVRFRPTVLGGVRGEEVIRRLNRLSEPFTVRVVAAGGRYFLEGTLETAGLRK